MLFNYKLIISYDGSNFYGFQRQSKQRSIQEALEKAISRLNANTKVNIIASGRTDKGVHACKQTCNFISENNLNLDYFHYALNRLLPDDIHVESVEEVELDFHSRYHAKQKHYRYIINTKTYDVFNAKYQWHLNNNLDVDKMRKACNSFIGKKDFRTFSSAEDEQTTVRSITELTVHEVDGLITIDVVGDGFLRYMVRKIVMCLVDIGKHKKEIEDIDILLSQRDISAYSKVAPPHGLYLMEVFYE